MNLFGALMCFALLLEGIFGEDSEVRGTYSACQHDIKRLQSQIGFSANQARMELSAIIVGMKNNIDAVRDDINIQLTEVNTKLERAEGPNEPVCVEELKSMIGQLSKHDISRCYVDTELDVLNSLVVQLNSLKVACDQICGGCSLQCVNSEIQKSCIESNIDTVVKQVEWRLNDFASGAITIQNKSSQCTEEIDSDQSEIISVAVTNFENCLQKPTGI